MSQHACERTCTNSGMVCMFAISPLFIGSLARMWSAPAQPSTISSIRTPSWETEKNTKKCKIQENLPYKMECIRKNLGEGSSVTVPVICLNMCASDKQEALCTEWEWNRVKSKHPVSALAIEIDILEWWPNGGTTASIMSFWPKNTFPF